MLKVQLTNVVWPQSTALSRGLPIDHGGTGQLVGDNILITQALTPGIWLPEVVAGQAQLMLPASIAVTPGDAVVITDCQRTEVIKVAQVASQLPERITLASAVQHEFANGAKIMPLKTRIWYLGKTAQPDQYALYAMDQRLARHEILPGLTGFVLQSDDGAMTLTIQVGSAREQLWLSSRDLF